MTHSFPHDVLTANPHFESGEEALKWAVEVLRRQRMPKTSSFLKSLPGEVDLVAGHWEGPKNTSLPQEGEERRHLAMKVMGALEEVRGEDATIGQMLHLWVWGDWADEGRLAVAVAIQEKCRRDGVRVRLSYRYSYEQLGVILGKDRKAAWRKVKEGLVMLDEKLAGKGLLMGVVRGEMLENNFKKMIYIHDFKKLNE